MSLLWIFKKLNRKCNDNKNCEYVFSGPGVERIYDEVKKIFSDKEIVIFSSDTMNKNLLQKF